MLAMLKPSLTILITLVRDLDRDTVFPCFQRTASQIRGHNIIERRNRWAIALYTQLSFDKRESWFFEVSCFMVMRALC